MLPTLGELRPWLDPEVVAINRLPMHTPLRRARTTSLNGQWSFRRFDHPDLVPASALTGKPGNTVTVPGNWTLQGTVDTPHYTNVQMPFPGPPPALPDVVPTGVYRRTISVPTSWSGQQIVLHVGAAESVHAVYLDGRVIGYGTDSRLPSEYDITAAVGRETTHELAIVVLRYSAHSYIEDQDQWWMAGLHRSVHLEARPIVHVADVVTTGDLDPSTGAGSVTAAVTVGFVSPPSPGWRVRFTLRDPRGETVGEPRIVDVPHLFAQPYLFRGHVVDVAWDIHSAQPWSAESPALYAVTTELLAPNDRVVETHTTRVGLRRVEVRDRQLLVNGQPIWVFGVNRHDHHPDRGKAVTEADMRADLVQMRAHNITAVRTAHYPNDAAFYDLCDELGMYVIDEANVENHAYNTSLCHDPRYRSAYLARGSRMVERDRNHACIIAWSLGNESGYGANHDAMAGWIRRSDTTRPLHYEGAIFHGDGTLPAGPANWLDGGLHASDIVCPMYSTIEAITAYGLAGLGTRPLIMCEYSHAMGNSNGSLADYWEAFEHTPGLQGGFIWEWKDHGIRRIGPDGRKRLAYGGDFGDSPHDGNFVADGLMSADLEPHPVMREVAWVYRPVTVGRSGRQSLRVTNRQSFVGLDQLRCDWELVVDGAVAERGVLAVPPIGPRQAAEVPLPCATPRRVGDARLTVRWSTTHDTWFASAGHLVAWDEIELAGGARAAPPPAGDGRSAEAVMTRPVALHLMRAPTDNDGFKLLPDLSERIGVGGRAWAAWKGQGVLHLDPETLVAHTMTASTADDGSVTYRHLVEVPEALADLPRVGVRFAVPARFRRIRWFGRGPHENYPDRQSSAMVGIWEGRPDELPYLVPQEFGLRGEVHWMELIDDRRGDVVRVDALAPRTAWMRAVRYADEDLLAAANQADVGQGPDLFVHIDVAHRGLGTASCGPDVADRYRIPAGRFEFSYRVAVRRLS